MHVVSIFLCHLCRKLSLYIKVQKVSHLFFTVGLTIKIAYKFPSNLAGSISEMTLALIILRSSFCHKTFVTANEVER